MRWMVPYHGKPEWGGNTQLMQPGDLHQLRIADDIVENKAENNNCRLRAIHPILSGPTVALDMIAHCQNRYAC
jgi:hypothetical protein